MPERTYIKAITSALADAMRDDDRVFCLGEDVAEGGPYTATAGLAEEFGIDRVLNTPISEAAITGVAIGAAQSGRRPVLEIMFVDFITLALDQLVNGAAKAHFMSGGQLTVPLVLRTQGGAGHRSGAQHSQSLEAWLTHVPGLKVVMPSRPSDAAGLLRSAIADPNPVVFIENKTLYFRKGDVPEPLPPVPIGEAITLRAGGDVTIVALSRLVRRRAHGRRAPRRRGRDRGGGDRSAHARSTRSRTRSPPPSAAPGERSSPTRRSSTAASAPRSQRRSSGRRSTISTRRSFGSVLRSRRSRSAPHSRTRTCRASTRSSRQPGRRVRTVLELARRTRRTIRSPDR